MELVDTILKIKADKMPPCNKFIEDKIKEFGADPVRWAIVEIEGDELTISLSGIKL